MEWPLQTNSLSRQISVKSAVNPSLWACVVISLPLFVMSTRIVGILSFAFFGIALLPVLAFIISYMYLLFKNPNYLRSEEYQLKAESLKLLGDKDNKLNAQADHVISIVTNPQLPEPTESQPNNLEQLAGPASKNPENE